MKQFPFTPERSVTSVYSSLLYTVLCMYCHMRLLVSVINLSRYYLLYLHDYWLYFLHLYCQCDIASVITTTSSLPASEP